MQILQGDGLAVALFVFEFAVKLLSAFGELVCRRRHCRGNFVYACDDGFLDAAEAIAAVFASYCGVGTTPESFGMHGVGQLPPDGNHQSGEEKTPAEKALYEQHRCVHHHVTPVEDSAVHAAAVSHHVFLEWAEQHHADKI